MSTEIDIAIATRLHRMATAGIGTELHTDSPEWVARVAKAIRAERLHDELVAALRKLLVSLEPGAQADGHEFWHAKREATATLAKAEASG